MAETRLVLEKVAALAGLSGEHSRRKFRNAKIGKSDSRARNGKHPGEYALSLLPADVQAKYAEEARKGLAIVHIPEQTLPLFASVPALQSPPRVAIPEDLEDEARTRLKAIEPLLDFRKRTNGSRAEVILSDGHRVKNLQEIAKWIASQQNPPIHPSTIWGWLARFDHGGFASLANRPRKDRGQSRFFEEHTTAAAFLQNKFLKEGLSREMAWEALCRDWRRIGEKGLTPCYDTARNFLNALPEPLKVLARDGKETHERLCSPFIQRSKVPVMDWWVSDHREFDVLVRNTLFAEKKQDEAYRLWLTALYDWGSRKIVGFCLAPTPSKRTINSSIRLGVLSHGFPGNFYWDNGKDYGSARADLELITLSEEAQTLLQHRQIGITSAIPKRPRSKPIESWFARWSKRFDVLWRPAYLGNKPGNRPESGSESQKQHEKYLAGKRSDSPLPTDFEFIVATVQWIEEYNETRLESLDHRTPNEVMEEAHPERDRPKINPRLLDILFSERTKRIVQKGGCVQLDGMRYEPTDESLFALDARYKQEVAILRDPYNLGEAVAADAETLQFVGELRMQEFIAQCPNGRVTRDQIQAALRRERSLRKGYANYLAALSTLAAGQGWKTEREELVDRALARTGTDGHLLPAAGVPGARLISERSSPQKLSSPFVDDAVRDFLADESDPLAKDTES
jgi:transposase InsO family protein